MDCYFYLENKILFNPMVIDFERNKKLLTNNLLSCFTLKKELVEKLQKEKRID